MYFDDWPPITTHDDGSVYTFLFTFHVDIDGDEEEDGADGVLDAEEFAATFCASTCDRLGGANVGAGVDDLLELDDADFDVAIKNKLKNIPILYRKFIEWKIKKYPSLDGILF